MDLNLSNGNIHTDCLYHIHLISFLFLKRGQSSKIFLFLTTSTTLVLMTQQKYLKHMLMKSSYWFGYHVDTVLKHFTYSWTNDVEQDDYTFKVRMQSYSLQNLLSVYPDKEILLAQHTWNIMTQEAFNSFRAATTNTNRFCGYSTDNSINICGFPTYFYIFPKIFCLCN